MPALNITQISDLTGMARKTVTKRLEGLPYTGGEYASDPKIYDAPAALARVYATGPQSVDGEMTNAQAASLLAQTKTAEIELDMQITRKERIPLEVVTQVNEEAFSAVSQMLKAQLGKSVTSEVLTEWLAELRGIGERISERAA